MNITTNNKWQGRALAAILFVLGFTTGILALNLYRAWLAMLRRAIGLSSSRIGSNSMRIKGRRCSRYSVTHENN
jgi:hypothetical protein